MAAGLALFALHDQIKQQRKQTEFLLGDTLPSMDVTEDQEDREQIVVRIVNWNRRGLILLGVDFKGIATDAKVGIMELMVNGADWSRENHIGYPYLRGWIDRQKARPLLSTNWQ